MHRKQFHLPDDHLIDIHFHASRLAWMENKREIQRSEGCGGLVEYAWSSLSHSEGLSADVLRYVAAFNTDSLVATPTSDRLRAFDTLRNSILLLSQSEKRSKVPKELSAITEQTHIPVYIDGFSRPTRKCRMK